jgi:hypothetical protein
MIMSNEVATRRRLLIHVTVILFGILGILIYQKVQEEQEARIQQAAEQRHQEERKQREKALIEALEAKAEHEARLRAAESNTESATNKYPWDKRPARCFESNSENDSACVLDNWPTWDATLQRVAHLYNIENFVLLDRAMHELVSSEKRFVNGDSPAGAVYWAFRRLIPAPGSEQHHQVMLSRWKAAVPTSYFVAFVQARILYADAWNARGSGFVGSVSKESWELFRIRLQEAEQVLRDAPQALKDTPLWHNLLLAIVQDGPRNASEADAVFEDAVSRWPTYFDFYEVRLTRLVPQWGGSWDQVESFITKWSIELARTEGSSLYARLYVSIKNQGYSPEQTAMNWARMNASFKDLTNRYPSPNFKNLYASYACFARDKATFSAAMRKLSRGELNPRDWLSGHSYEACMRWAGV